MIVNVVFGRPRSLTSGNFKYEFLWNSVLTFLRMDFLIEESRTKSRIVWFGIRRYGRLLFSEVILDDFNFQLFDFETSGLHSGAAYVRIDFIWSWKMVMRLDFRRNGLDSFRTGYR